MEHRNRRVEIAQKLDLGRGCDRRRTLLSLDRLKDISSAIARAKLIDSSYALAVQRGRHQFWRGLSYEILKATVPTHVNYSY